MISSRFPVRVARSTPFVSRALTSLVVTKAKFRFLNSNRAFGAPARQEVARDFPATSGFNVRPYLPIAVFKFGGSSLGNADAIREACAIGRDMFKKQNVCIVVSALLGVTNKLEAACHAAVAGNSEEVEKLRNELRQHHVDRAAELFSDELALLKSVSTTVDEILGEYFDPYIEKIMAARCFHDNWFLAVSGLGERLSVPIVAGAMSLYNIPATEVYTEKLIISDAAANNKSGVNMTETRSRLQSTLLPLIHSGVVPVVSGFIAGTIEGTVVTLGRGGSDLTSTLLANSIDANEVHLWKVESNSLPSGFMKSWKGYEDQFKWTGIRSVCPNTVKESHIVRTMSYEEAAELTHFGKKVLHMATMEPISGKRIPLFVRNTAIPSHPGTQIGISTEYAGGSNDNVNAVAVISYENYKKLHSKKQHLSGLFTKIEELSQKGTDMSIVSLIGSNLGPSWVDKMTAALADFSPLELSKSMSALIGTANSVSVVVPTKKIGEVQEIIHSRFVKPVEGNEPLRKTIEQGSRMAPFYSESYVLGSMFS